jgi:hypothetical protein
MQTGGAQAMHPVHSGHAKPEHPNRDQIVTTLERRERQEQE